MDPYELIRRLNFSPTTRTWADQEAGGGVEHTNTTWDLSGDKGWDDLGQFRSKYNEVIDNGDGTFGVIYQNPTAGKNHKYDTLVATYAKDPESGEYVMVGDPQERRETSSMNQFQDFAEKGGLLVGSILGAGYLSGVGAGAGGAGGAGGGMTAAQAAAMNPEMYGLAAQTGLGGGATAGGAGLLGGGSTVAGGSIGDAALGSWGSWGFDPSVITSGAGARTKGATGLLDGDLLKLGVTALGAYEGSKEQPGEKTTNAKTLDPRIDERVFGNGGLLSNADAWYQKNKSGQNDQMIQAQNWMRGLLTNPNMQQGLTQMASTGQGLMNAPMAGNPFLNWKPRG